MASGGKAKKGGRIFFRKHGDEQWWGCRGGASMPKYADVRAAAIGKLILR